MAKPQQVTPSDSVSLTRARQATSETLSPSSRRSVWRVYVKTWALPTFEWHRLWRLVGERLDIWYCSIKVRRIILWRSPPSAPPGLQQSMWLWPCAPLPLPLLLPPPRQLTPQQHQQIQHQITQMYQLYQTPNDFGIRGPGGFRSAYARRDRLLFPQFGPLARRPRRSTASGLGIQLALQAAGDHDGAV